MPLIDSFRNASPSRQLVAMGGGVAVVALALAVLYIVFLRSDFDPLFGDLSVADASRIAEELEAQAIPYRLESDGTAISVPSSDVDQARLAVMRADLPLESTVGFELFNESNIGLTEFAQKINYQRALQGELVRTIMALDLVEAARVHISMAEQTIFRGDRTPPTASVTLLTRRGRTLPPATVEGIQRLVAASVPDLDVENVVILDHTGQVVSGDIVSPAMASPEARERYAIESYFAARIEQDLQAYRRDADFDVSVRALDGEAPALVQGEPAEWMGGGPREFGLAIVVSTELAADPAEAAAIRQRVRDLVGYSPDASDSIAVTMPQVTVTPRQPQATGPTSQTPQQPVGSPVAPISVFGWILLALSLGAIAWVAGRRRNRAMSDGERKAMITRFDQLLNGEGTDARR